MKLSKLEQEKSNNNLSCFIDSNVFLELELDQERADECEALLNKVRKGSLRAVITGFHIDGILIIMENYGKGPDDLKTFLSSLLGYKGLEIYLLSLLDRISATKWMNKLNLDLDDAIAYYVMMRFNIDKIVSYDKHFDPIKDIMRLEPSQLQSD